MAYLLQFPVSDMGKPGQHYIVSLAKKDNGVVFLGGPWAEWGGVIQASHKE